MASTRGVLIRGPMGAGKSSVSRKVYEILRNVPMRAVRLSVDGLKKLTTRSEPEVDVLELTTRIIANMYKEYLPERYFTVIEGVFYDNKFVNPILAINPNIDIYRLHCDYDLNVQRDVNRKSVFSVGKDKIKQAHEIFDKLPLYDNEKIIDTTNMSIDEVAGIIVDPIIDNYFGLIAEMVKKS